MPKFSGHQPRWMGAVAALLWLAVTLGCNATTLLQPATPTAVPTRALAPTWTPTPVSVAPLVVVTPPHDGTPGVIIIQPTLDSDKIVIEIPPTDTPVPPPPPTLPPTETPWPTATPLPTATLAPGEVAGPAPALPTATAVIAPELLTPPTLPPIITPDTPTPLPPPTNTPGPPPTPYVVVESGYVALRTGPGLDYPMVAQLGPSIPIAIIGRNPEGSWYEVCCVNGGSVWVAATHVRVVNDTGQSPLVVSQPAPSPSWTPTPTWTATVTPTPTPTAYPFERAIGPQFFPTDNQFLTIWAYLFVGDLNNTLSPEEPVGGYCVDVKFENFDRPNTNVDAPSRDAYEWSAPPGAGNRVKYNYKYEYLPTDPKLIDPNTQDTRLTLLGTGTWSVFVTDCAGRQLSDAVVFTTAPSNPNREVYIGWVRRR